MTTEDDGEGITGRSSGEGMDVYTFSGVKKGWQREMGKEERIWWEMWVKERKRGVGEVF